MNKWLVTILAIEEHDSIRLVDAAGNSIGKVKAVHGTVDGDTVQLISERHAWKRWASENIRRISSEVANNVGGPWKAKINIMAASCNRRSLPSRRSKKGTYKLEYETTTWGDALGRLRTTANNGYRRSEATWRTWCHNRVRSQTQRVEGRRQAILRREENNRKEIV